MQIRSDDPAFLFHVAKWWRVLFARVRPYLYHHGGPIVMVQVRRVLLVLVFGLKWDDIHTRNTLVIAFHVSHPFMCTKPDSIHALSSLIAFMPLHQA